jgi:hypothetical protein
MKKSTEKLISFLENYNRWRRGSYLHEQPVPEELGQRLDQAVDLLKKMTWQPMETAPKDREFLGVWGSSVDLQDKSVDLFRYDQEAQHYVWSNYGGAVYVPSAELFAWMEIPKHEG